MISEIAAAHGKSSAQVILRWNLQKGVVVITGSSISVFFIALIAVPGTVLRLFDASEYMLEVGKPALRILAAAWFISIPNLVFGASLQGLSMGTKSMYLMMARQAVLPVLLILLFRRFGVLNLIWSAFALAECLAIPLAWYLWRGSKAAYGSGAYENGINQ